MIVHGIVTYLQAAVDKKTRNVESKFALPVIYPDDRPDFIISSVMQKRI
jgi:hypothetical protein